MKIKNMTYASTPVATKLGTFTPDAEGVLDVPEDAAKLLISLAGFVSQQRTPRALASPPAPVFPTPAPEVPAVLTEPTKSTESPALAPSEPVEARAATEPPASRPEPEAPPARPRGPKPKTR